VLRVEERPTGHAGVIQSIHDHVLSVHSGPNIENWNIMETTIMNGAARSEVKAGDEIGVKLYRNHNLAELRVIRSGAR